MMIWLENELATSQGYWKIVVGHRHIFSASWDDGPISEPNYSQLRPLLIQYGVDIYLCGHDHNLQHLSNIENKDVDYFISGAGGSPMSSDIDEDVVNTLNQTYGIKVDSFEFSFGFISFTVSESEIIAEMVSRRTEILYTYSRRK